MYTYPSESSVKANLLYIPGYGENCGMNAHFFTKMAQENISTYAMDRRGFGSNSRISGINKGEISSSTGLITDILAQIRLI